MVTPDVAGADAGGARPVFAADSIGRRFGAREVLRTASVWAHAGRITALLGRNGCGKSTLLRVAAGEIAADHGAIHFLGRVWQRPRLHRLATRGLFYLPQRGLLAPWRSLRAHMDAVAWRFPAAHPAGVDAVAGWIGLGELLDVPAIELSGGERRRAELAIALLRRPVCLLADEPFAGLSPLDAEAVAAALGELAGAGCAIVVTGHEVPLLFQAADDIVWLTAGTTHALGAPAAAAAHDQFRREYLGAAGVGSGG